MNATATMIGSATFAGGRLPAHLASRPAFVAAARHSRRVRFLRRAIPLAGIAGLAAALFATLSGILAPPPADLSIDRVALRDRKIVMEKPRLSGFKRDGSSYEMTAANATQDLASPNLVDLEALTARIRTGAEGWANLSGEAGRFDSKAERLDMKGTVSVKTDSGIEARLRDAVIDFKSGSVLTEQPTEVKTNHGNVRSDRLEVLESGKRLVFEGNVQSVFVNNVRPERQSAAEEESR